MGETEVLKEILRRCRAGECHSRAWLPRPMSSISTTLKRIH